MLRTTMIFSRDRAKRSLRTPLITAAVLVLMLLVGGLAVWNLAPSHARSALDGFPGVTLDTDDDGILDEIERGGWETPAGIRYRTDPTTPDTDDDGLTDLEEAGPVVADGDEVVYAGRTDPTRVDSDEDGLPDAVEWGEPGINEGQVPAWALSNPLEPDTDGDGVEDGDEFYLDMDPALPDTDGDGLVDADELDFGSDPTLANLDDDQYDDLEEFEEGLDPVSYDLTKSEMARAAEVGFACGDSDACASKAGLRIELIESAAYLGGHLASGLSGLGDVRDTVANLWEGNFADAGISAVGLVPGPGDAVKTAALLTKFAKRSDRARQAAREVTDELPLPSSWKTETGAKLGSQAGKLPLELRGGPKVYVVYKGDDYIGITADFPQRSVQHARAGRTFEPEPIPGLGKLTRGEARSVEQYCISRGGLAPEGRLQNKINSIDPQHPYTPDAVIYGADLLTAVGGTCPI